MLTSKEWPFKFSEEFHVPLMGLVAALYSSVIDMYAKIKRAAACFLSQVYHHCKKIVYNY